ncbi:hypothetical protein GE061_001308 [Apolygus lucorum]|uniref:Uncharacterized protein n=1 Tax=Apolygus lucorum TaxID=248454 RepID=A0A8S9Y6P6_APOLU|nr:hypothetical protein GE061_001308 [Apolygus lucorum]
MLLISCLGQELPEGRRTLEKGSIREIKGPRRVLVHIPRLNLDWIRHIDQVRPRRAEDLPTVAPVQVISSTENPYSGATPTLIGKISNTSPRAPEPALLIRIVPPTLLP